MKTKLFHALLLGAFLSVSGAENDLKLSQDGSFAAGDLNITVLSKEDSGRLQNSGPETIPVMHGFTKDGNRFVFRSPFKTSLGTFQLEETLTEEKPGEWLFKAVLTASAPTRVNELSLFMTLPGTLFAGKTVVFGGKPVVLPGQFKERHLIDSKEFKALQFNSQDRVITVSGDSDLIFQDERCDGWNIFSLRTRFRPFSGVITRAEATLRITVGNAESAMLDISKVCNMGFADEVAGDGKGGWTDQGSNNDLRIFKPGKQTFNDIPFQVIDPQANGGKSCLVLSKDPSMQFPSEAKISANGASGKFLHLLHSAAYTAGDKKVGDVQVVYEDGTSSVFPVITGKHVSDWWGGAALSDGELVWTGLNASSLVGMYACSVPLQAKPLKEVKFSTDTGAVWMIVGATVSNAALAHADRTPVFITESAEWRPVEYPRDVEKGSVLDFSVLGLQDAPAGKYGYLTKDEEGHFVFEKRPSVPVRFYGTNLCYMGNFFSKENAEKLADRLAANGFNTVRFHHYDIMFDNAAGKSTKLKADMLDQLDYLFHCLKQRGIYVMIDLYCSRNFSDGELPGFENRRFYPFNGTSLGEIKAFLLLTDVGFENFKEFARNLLGHVNPYTGMAWKDDPALAHISLINEDAIFEVINYDREIRSILEKKFEKEQPGLKGAERTLAFNRFLIRTYNESYQRMARFLKEELGVKAMLTDQNHWQSTHQAPMNRQYDFVDKHMYWAHPRGVGPQGKGFSFDSSSAIAQMGGLAINMNSAARVFGLPYGASEMNYCFPSPYRAEGGPLLGAYAALQDWGTVWQFCYLANDKAFYEDHAIDLFEMATDPVMFLNDKLAVLFFLRGDVRRSELKFPIHVPEDYSSIHDIYPAAYIKAGTFARIGAQVGNKVGAAADITAFSAENFTHLVKEAARKNGGTFEPERSFSKSVTGEIEIDGKAGTFKVVTPRSEALVLPEGKTEKAGLLEVGNQKGFAVYAAAAMDSSALADSRRILFLHITNVFNSGMQFADKTLSQVMELGGMPHLAAAGTGTVALKLNDGPAPIVYAVDLGGRRIGRIDSEFSGGVLRFTADVFAQKSPCFVYEIVR